METEREEFEALVRRCQAAVCAVAFARLRDRGHSEEVAQEAFLVAWLRRGDTVPSVGWICGIARNLARNTRRRLREVTMSTEPSSRDPRDEMIDRERASQAVEALAGLPERYREAVVLYYRSDESLAEVAEALGITEVAARKRVSRGRAKLREALAGVEDSLRGSKPSAAFTAAVIAAWLVRGRDAAAATAASAAATSATAGTYLLFGGIAAGGVAVIGTIIAAATGAFASTPRASGASAKTAPGARSKLLAETSSGGASVAHGAIAAGAAPALPERQTMDIALQDAPVIDLISLCGAAASIPIAVDPNVPSSLTSIRGQGLDPIAVLDQTLAQIHAQREEVQAIKLVSFGGRSDASSLGGDPVTIHIASWPIGSAVRILAAPLHMPIGGYLSLPPPNPDDPLPDQPLVSLDVDNVPAGAALERILAQTHLGYEFASGFRITVKAD